MLCHQFLLFVELFQSQHSAILNFAFRGKAELYSAKRHIHSVTMFQSQRCMHSCLQGPVSCMGDLSTWKIKLLSRLSPQEQTRESDGCSRADLAGYANVARANGSLMQLCPALSHTQTRVLRLNCTVYLRNRLCLTHQTFWTSCCKWTQGLNDLIAFTNEKKKEEKDNLKQKRKNWKNKNKATLYKKNLKKAVIKIVASLICLLLAA